MLTRMHLPAEDALMEARRIIGRSDSFSSCGPEVLDELVAAGHLKRLGAGENVALRGAAPDCVGMVVTGSIEVSASWVDGHRHFVGLIAPGDFYGLFNFVDGQPHPHDLVAREQTSVLAISHPTLLRLRARHPSVVLACERHLARRLRFLYQRLCADPGVPLESRVASTLLMVGRLYGHAAGPHIELDFKLSQTDLADWLGLSRQRVNFALKQLESERLIRLHYSTLTITDPKGLEAVAASGEGGGAANPASPPRRGARSESSD